MRSLRPVPAQPSGELRPLGSQTTVVPGSPHCSLDPSGSVLICSTMLGGGVTSYPVAADGSLRPHASVHELPGGGTGACLARPGFGGTVGSQGQNMGHSAQLAMDGKRVFVPDLGADRVWAFDIDTTTGATDYAQVPSFKAPDGCGPRHLAAHPNGRWLYLITEMACTVIALEYDSDSGEMAEIGTTSTLPADWGGRYSVAGGWTGTYEYDASHPGCTTADIHVSADGRFV